MNVVRMTSRHISSTFDPAIVARIDAALDEIEVREEVRVLHAIESGSRAWGFPSPDSDYDCRFIFARRSDAYLSLWPPRDVIELPLVDELDVNGWDVGKALKLLLKGNAVAIEWLTSPLVYRSDPNVRAALLAFADRHVSAPRVALHYLHLGEGQRRRLLQDGEAVALKKLFYVLRPAAALRWLRLHPGRAVAPMHLPTLLAACDLPASVHSAIDELIARKAETRELGCGIAPRAILDFVDEEFEIGTASWTGAAETVDSEARVEADALFKRIACS